MSKLLRAGILSLLLGLTPMVTWADQINYGQARLEWNRALLPHGIIPCYPLLENLFVGDVYVQKGGPYELVKYYERNVHFRNGGRGLNPDFGPTSITFDGPLSLRRTGRGIKNLFFGEHLPIVGNAYLGHIELESEIEKDQGITPEFEGTPVDPEKPNKVFKSSQVTTHKKTRDGGWEASVKAKIADQTLLEVTPFSLTGKGSPSRETSIENYEAPPAAPVAQATVSLDSVSLADININGSRLADLPLSKVKLNGQSLGALKFGGGAPPATGLDTMSFLKKTPSGGVSGNKLAWNDLKMGDLYLNVPPANGQTLQDKKILNLLIPPAAPGSTLQTVLLPFNLKQVLDDSFQITPPTPAPVVPAPLVPAAAPAPLVLARLTLASPGGIPYTLDQAEYDTIRPANVTLSSTKVYLANATAPKKSKEYKIRYKKAGDLTKQEHEIRLYQAPLPGFTVHHQQSVVLTALVPTQYVSTQLGIDYKKVDDADVSIDEAYSYRVPLTSFFDPTVQINGHTVLNTLATKYAGILANANYYKQNKDLFLTIEREVFYTKKIKVTLKGSFDFNSNLAANAGPVIISGENTTLPGGSVKISSVGEHTISLIREFDRPIAFGSKVSLFKVDGTLAAPAVTPFFDL